MKNIIKALLSKRYVIQFGNGKFLKLELLFIYMLFTSILAGWRYFYEFKHDLEFEALDVTVMRLICLLPWLIGISLMLRTLFVQNIKTVFDIPEDWWHTRLLLLAKSFRVKSKEEEELYEELLEDWESVYGVRFDESKFVAFQKWIPALLPVLVILLGYLLA